MACQKLLFLEDRNVGIYFITSFFPHLKFVLSMKKWINKEDTVGILKEQSSEEVKQQFW